MPHLSVPPAPTSASAPSNADWQVPAAPHPARPALSYELFPPRSEAQLSSLPNTIAALATTRPDYVSVTFGTGSSGPQSTARLLSEIIEQTDLRPLAHLTCASAPDAELRAIVRDFLDRGVRGFLALRGDLPAGERATPPGHLKHATHLVNAIREIEAENFARLCAGRVAIGVAAYPTGHTESPDVQHDIDVLLAKQRAGADFAITQVFFDAHEYTSLLRSARLAGVRLPIIPGVLPLTDPRRVRRLSALAGRPAPAALLARLEAATTQTERERIGLDATLELVSTVLDAGAPGIHLYTFNDHRSALRLIEELDLGSRTVTSEGIL